MAKEHWTDDYVKMVEDCENRESMLSEWEAGFIESVGNQLAEQQRISPKQIETLEKIWDKVTG